MLRIGAGIEGHADIIERAIKIEGRFECAAPHPENGKSFLVRQQAARTKHVDMFR